MPARRRARATTATCLPRRAAMRSPQFLGLRRVPAKDGDRGLNQEPAGARVAGIGDGAAALGFAGAVLAGHEAEIGFELMRVVEAPDVVEATAPGR
jgi:hypothetical protein